MLYIPSNECAFEKCHIHGAEEYLTLFEDFLALFSLATVQLCIIFSISMVCCVCDTADSMCASIDWPPPQSLKLPVKKSSSCVYFDPSTYWFALL